MNISKTANRLMCASILAAGSAVAVAIPVSASTAHQGYSCAQNPNQSKCKTHGHGTNKPAAHPVTGAGGTAPSAGTNVVGTSSLTSSGSPNRLPSTGGANPGSPDGNAGILGLLATALLAAGIGVRRRIRSL
jgi:hypothetical protein